MSQHTQPFSIVLPSDGEIVTLGGLTATVKIPSTTTQGAVAIVEHTLAAGCLGAPLHTHQREDEVSYILEGELTVQIGDAIQLVAAGAYIFKPRGILHTLWNAGPQRVRFIEIIAPGGFETYFAARVKLDPAARPADRAALAALQEQYAVTFERDSVPDLLQRYGLRMT